ncbi:Glycosyltransferase involved in cell wall bisynthesis [Belliella buryatensis]|uniref:Glycosyltransferase involved in cell wall bisynthesis n=1 Tax=Belliella buryatensis TaxID=1500549 RepID=A0A239CVL4_9BACT|nr:glycosyltransferase family 4 protein [Belliella buryatensis]SNS23393.1 Glycosyltransferase involved in cell wall bisynthesis [Belliella buryatensis]
MELEVRKVLFVIPANLVNGELNISTFLTSEINALKNEFELVEVFYFINRRSISGFIYNLKKLNTLIERFKPDVIHSHYGSTTGLLVSLSSKFCPWVITFGGSELLGHPNKGLYWRIRELWAVRLSHFAALKADHIICVSQNLINSLSKNNQSKTTLIPRGVDISKFTKKDKFEARNYLNWSVEKKYVLFSFPRLNAEVKNKELAENVISLLTDKGVNIELIILYNRSQEYIFNALNAADALLVTSFHEGSPNIVKEAMACNLPIVSVNCGDVKERLERVSPSFISFTYDAQELSEGLERVLDKGQRSNGLKYILENGIDMKNTISKIISVYNFIIYKKNKINM